MNILNYRAIREFCLAVRMMKTPTITEDEIANAAGVGDMHDGVNFMRAACVIAVEKVSDVLLGFCLIKSRYKIYEINPAISFP